MEPTFLSKRELRDRMLVPYYARLDRYRPLHGALANLAQEFSSILGPSPGRHAAGRSRPSDSYWPSEAAGLLSAFVNRWALPQDVGVLDVWDSICDGPRARASDATTRRYRLRIGDRPWPGIRLQQEEIDELARREMTPDDIESPGWFRVGESRRSGPALDEEPWSALQLHDPTGVVGELTQRPEARRRLLKASIDRRSAQALLDGIEMRLQDEKRFGRPGPRTTRKELERGASRLFRRAVLSMTYASITDIEARAGGAFDESTVRRQTDNWARLLKIELPPREVPAGA